jgi:hypothetical protein
MRSDDLRRQTAYPLAWPAAWKRTEFRRSAPFRGATVSSSTWEVLKELRLLGAKEVTISTNVELRLDGLPKSNRAPNGDPGVAVYFTVSDAPRVLACDRWTKVEDNLRAVARHIEAVRGQDRWGVGNIDQAFAGYVALPERASRDCWSILGLLPSDRSLGRVRSAFAEKIKAIHPDHGGDGSGIGELIAARDQAITELSGGNGDA